MGFSPTLADPNEAPIAVPVEVLMLVFSWLPFGRIPQLTLYACVLVCRSWYRAAIERLYENPWISSKNFSKFFNTICPIIKIRDVKPNGFSDFIRVLDLGKLLYDGSKSTTAKLIGRTKGRLQEFVAPQVSFGLNCLVVLAKCHNLRRMDLSLVSKSFDIEDFFKAIRNLSRLEFLSLPHTSLRLPPSSSGHADTSFVVWPQSLSELCLAGELRPGLLPYFSNLPPSLTSLKVGDASRMTTETYTGFMEPFLDLVGHQLLSVTITNPFSVSHEIKLDEILQKLPIIRHLCISAELITSEFFQHAFELTNPSPLADLEVDCPMHPGRGMANGSPFIKHDMVSTAVEDGSLGRLRRVRVHRTLGWGVGKQDLEDVRGLGALLESLAEEDGDGAVIKKCDAGVWMFGTAGP